MSTGIEPFQGILSIFVHTKDYTAEHSRKKYLPFLTHLTNREGVYTPLRVIVVYLYSTYDIPRAAFIVFAESDFAKLFKNVNTTKLLYRVWFVRFGKSVG